MRCQYHSMDNGSGVGVLDKAAVVLGALEAGPSTLAQLVAAMVARGDGGLDHSGLLKLTKELSGR